MSRKDEEWDMPARIEPDKNTFAGRIAIRLRKLREEAGLSPQQLAEAVGAKSQQTIYDWESGRVQPRVLQLPILSKALGVKLQNLLPKE